MAFRDRFETVEDFDDWLLGFYEERIIAYMDGVFITKQTQSIFLVYKEVSHLSSLSMLWAMIYY